MAQFRTSAHKYNVETRRYGRNRRSITNRICPSCTLSKETMENLSKLPFFKPILEDELHVLKCCKFYEEAQCKLRPSTQQTMISGSLEEIKGLFQETIAIQELARFLSCCHTHRFPKNEEQGRETITQ